MTSDEEILSDFHQRKRNMLRRTGLALAVMLVYLALSKGITPWPAVVHAPTRSSTSPSGVPYSISTTRCAGVVPDTVTRAVPRVSPRPEARYQSGPYRAMSAV